MPGYEADLYAAGAGDKIGIVYLSRSVCPSSSTNGNIYFTLIDSKGQRLLASDVQLTSHNCVASYALGSDIVWNGQEFGVVWTERFIPGNNTYPQYMMFQRIDANGTPVGTPVNLTTLTPGGESAAAMPWSPRMAFMPGVGYAVVTGKGSQPFDFQRLGIDGMHPEPAVTYSYTFWQGACTLAASDKLFAILAEGSSDDTVLFRLNTDGTMTSSSYTVAQELENTRPQLFSFGDSWLAAHAESGYYSGNAYVFRGSELQHKHALFKTSSGPAYAERAALDSDILSVSIIQGSPGIIPVYRYRIPQDPAAAPVLVGAPFDILSNPNASGGHALVSTSAKALVSIWLDTRYGGTELFSASADVSGCP